MIKTLSEEQVNGIGIHWAGGLTEDVHETVRLWVERYRDMLPPLCTTLVVSWDAFAFAVEGGYAVTAVQDEPGTFILLIGDAWHSQPNDREHRFVLERLIRQWIAERMLFQEGKDWVLRKSGNSVVRGAERDDFLRAVAEGLVINRSMFGGDKPPCPLR